ncbi:MAG: NAD(P)H-hydrate dehydratase [Actinobacteria bacterium]|nr:NAD(P)H-hydrate dehydratase [Actinomycetota bacterium]
MKPVLSPEQAAALDRETQARGIPAELLMERAGRAVARAAVDLCGGAYGRRAVVVCGKGNNGGDGFVAARHLASEGMRVTVVTVERPDDLREPAASNFRRLGEQDVRLRPFSDASLRRELARADVAVDAIFGTGFRGIPEDDWAAAIAGLNAAAAPVVAVDIPSGVNGASGAVEGEAVWASLTVTFGAAKTGATLLPGAELAGAVRVVDIGFPAELIGATAWLTEPSDVAAALPMRAADSHKRASGVLLVVAGSRGMTGAARLIASGAARIGTGLVIVAAPAGVLPVVQAELTEAVFLPLAETADGTVSPEAVEPLLERAASAHAIAIGPGLTTQEETAKFVREVVRRSPVPLVVDADGLNAFAGRAAELADRSVEAILTPHAGEFGRLSGVKARDLDADRLGHARALAATTRAVVLLKGSRTVIAAPAGEVRINPTGSPVLATAGSGDVLTGMIGGLLARGVGPLDAAAAGAYLHGLAGLLGAAELGEGTVAGDLVSRIPEAVDRVRSAP